MAGLKIKDGKWSPGATGISWLARRYSKRDVRLLFLMCALPLHIWTMVLASRDVSWVTDRTNAWDAVGVFAYGLLFALFESLLVFLVMALMGLLLPGRLDRQKRLNLLTVLVIMASLWAIAEQLFFLLDGRLPAPFITFLLGSGHPLRTLYLVIIALLVITILVPVVLVHRSGKAAAFVQALIERLSLLAMFYLLLDVVAIVIVVARNV